MFKVTSFKLAVNRQFQNNNQLRIIRKTAAKDVWNNEHQKKSLLLKKRELYLNPSIKIHPLTDEEMFPFEVFFDEDLRSGCAKIVDVSAKNVNIQNAIFVVKTNGKMFITPDRLDDNRVKYNDGSVLCHHSFADSECFFAGLITLENGIPISICNESGTFFPSMTHTVRIRNVLANILNMPNYKIALGNF